MKPLPSIATKKSYQRFRYVINKRFQLRFVVFMDLVAFGVIGVFYGASCFFYSDLQNLPEMMPHLSVTEHQAIIEILSQRQQQLSRVFAASSFIVLGTLTLLGVLYSHRIAGPLYRLTRQLEALAAGGEPQPLVFREGDFFQEIPEAYNKHLRVAFQPSSDCSAGITVQDINRNLKPVV